MKGLLLAGGTGSRMFPLTAAISKQLLPVYDKPAIYYPLSTLMLAGIQDILVISTPHDTPLIERLLGNGERYGINLTYAVQNEPKGIAQAFIIAEKFIGIESVCLVLGDNVFYGNELPKKVQKASKLQNGAIVFGYHVHDPERYGVVEFDRNFKAISIEEKPMAPKSNWAVTGLYFYDNHVVDIAKNLKPSKRGELEITAVNNEYLAREQLQVEVLGRGIAWLDSGTPDSLLTASQFVQTIQERQGLKISCLEEIALHMNFISKDKMESFLTSYPESGYSRYIHSLIKKGP